MSHNHIFTPSNRSELQEILTQSNGSLVILAFVMNGCPACNDFKENVANINFSMPLSVALLDVETFGSLAEANGVVHVPTYYAIRFKDNNVQTSGSPQVGGDSAQLLKYIQQF